MNTRKMKYRLFIEKLPYSSNFLSQENPKQHQTNKQN